MCPTSPPAGCKSTGRMANTCARWAAAAIATLARVFEETAPDAVVVIGNEQHVCGLLAISDPIRPHAKAAVADLKEAGIQHVTMLTGDNRATGAAVGQATGVDEVKAELLPEDKVHVVEGLVARYGQVAMVGDGVNDAPALATADVGIAIGTGTDVAMETGSVTLMRGDLLGVVRAIGLARRTMRVIRQNLFWAFIYNVIGIPVAAGALYPAFGILLTPALAAAAMAVSSVSVVTNSLRLRRA